MCMRVAYMHQLQKLAGEVREYVAKDEGHEAALRSLDRSRSALWLCV